jgi:glutamate racemase
MDIPKGGIAFFDSGIGGLTVLSACRKVTHFPFYYYGDNTRAPYGNLPKEKIREYVMEAFDTFASLEVRTAVIACNTVTALLIDELRKRYAFPIVGTEPAVLPASNRNGEVFVLTTRRTYESERFKSLCHRAEKNNPNVHISPYPCDGLAGAIEKNIFNTETKYFNHLPQGTPTAVVLGCTHYIYIRKQIEEFYGCETIDGNEGIARRICRETGGQGGVEKGKIFFLGDSKNTNKRVYEQTFT